MSRDIGDAVGGKHRCRAGGCGGERHLVAPGADAVNAAAVGAHLNGVVGAGGKAFEGEGVCGNGSEVLLVAVDAKLPSSLLGSGGPAQLDAAGGGGAVGKGGGCRAGNLRGYSKTKGCALAFLSAAVGDKADFILGLAGQAGNVDSGAVHGDGIHAADSDDPRSLAGSRSPTEGDLMGSDDN